MIIHERAVVHGGGAALRASVEAPNGNGSQRRGIDAGEAAEPALARFLVERLSTLHVDAEPGWC